MLDKTSLESLLDYFLTFVRENFDIHPQKIPVIRYISDFRNFANLGEVSRSENVYGLCIPDDNLIILDGSSKLSDEMEILVSLHELSHWLFYSFSVYGEQIAQIVGHKPESLYHKISEYGVFGIPYFDDEGFAHWLSSLLFEYLVQNKVVPLMDEESIKIVNEFQEWQQSYNIYPLWYQMGFRINLRKKGEFHSAVVLPLLKSNGLLPEKEEPFSYKKFQIYKDGTHADVVIEIKRGSSGSTVLELPWLRLEVIM